MGKGYGGQTHRNCFGQEILGVGGKFFPVRWKNADFLFFFL